MYYSRLEISLLCFSRSTKSDSFARRVPAQVLPFAPQGMLTLLSRCIDRMNLYNSAAHFGEVAGEEAGAAWKDILNLLYELLGE